MKFNSKNHNITVSIYDIIRNRASYVDIGVDVEGNKDILGIWIGENESSKFWLGVMNDLKNRGVQDVMLFCLDGLTWLKEAIKLTKK